MKKLSLITLMFVFCFTYVAYGQFSLVSSSPAHGETNVSQTQELSLTFNAALDTNAVFKEPDDFFLGMLFFPDSAFEEPDSMALSEDLTTFTVYGFEFEPDSRYNILLMGAQSTSGEKLDKPYIITFTTGSSFPTGSVSGTISTDGAPVKGAIVALYNDLESEDPAYVTISDSTYTVNYVPDGSYYPYSLYDSNEDGDLDPSGSDASGFLDNNNDGQPDSVIVSGGSAVTGIDIELSVPTPVPASAGLTDILDHASEWATDAYLVEVDGNEINAQGEAYAWFYLFYSPALDEHKGFGKIGDLIFDDSYDEEDEDRYLSKTPLPETWVDSPTAAATAEANGGAEFRAGHDEVEVYASLHQFELFHNESEEDTAETVSPFKMKLRRNTIHQDSEFDHDLFVWQFYYNVDYDYDYYKDDDDGSYDDYYSPYFNIAINAQTGNTIQSDAIENREAADSVALDWAEDAALIHIHNAREIWHGGKTIAWAYTYQSEKLNTAVTLYAVSGHVLGMEYPEWYTGDAKPLPQQVCGSAEAFAIVQDTLQTFLDLYPDSYISMELYVNSWSELVEKTLWRIAVHAYSDSGEYNPEEHLELEVNAETCALFLDVETTGQTPGKFSLMQNYPNPFNPTTVINYSIQQAGDIELTIYNLLGQRVSVLVEEFKTKGEHTIRWNGRDSQGRPVPGGVYFYKIKTPDGEKSRRMLLLR